MTVSYKPQPVALVGRDYQGTLLRGILVEMDLELRRRASEDAASGGGSGAPGSASYVTLTASASLTAERRLTGTTNRVTITDGGANSTVTLSAPQDLHTTANFLTSSLDAFLATDRTGLRVRQFTAATLDLIQFSANNGTSHWYRIGSDGQSYFASSTTAGVVNIGAGVGSAVFKVGTSGTTGVLTLKPNQSSIYEIDVAGLSTTRFTSATKWSFLNSTALRGTTSGELTFAGPATITDYTLTWPNAQGSALQVLRQSATPGILEWATPTSSYTNEDAQDAVGAMVDGTLIYTDATPLLSRAALTGDVTASAGSNALTIASDAVTFAKFQNITDARLLGRNAGSTGDMQEITLGTNLSFTGTTLNATGGVAGHAILDGSVHLDSVAQGVTRGSMIYGNATPMWDELVKGSANTVLIAGATDVAWGTLDADFVSFAPATVANWNAGVDPGDVDDALDQLAANLNPLLPPSAPALDDIDFDTANGASGKNTWNATFAITNYANSPSDSAAGANAIDSTMAASGNLHGVYDGDTFVSAVGTLNADQTSAHPGTPTPAYPAFAFSPGGSDGGATNNLQLFVNNVLVHTVDLLTFGSGSSLTGGSGFTSLSAATPVKFSDGSSFAPRTYRTGSWVVALADCGIVGSRQGWTTVKIKHVTTAGTQTSDVHEFLLDDVDTATAYSSESISGYAGAGSKILSGVTYHTSGSATYNVTIDNAYRNTYRDGNAITYQETNVAAIADEALGASGGTEGLQVVKAKAITASGTRLLNATLTVTTTVDRTVQSDTASSGASVSGVLIDTVGTTSTNTVESFDDEVFRMRSNLSLTATTPYVSGGAGTNSPAPWDNTLTLASGTNTDGLLVSNGQFQYPTQGTNGGNFGGVTNGPAGNPNYSALTGLRSYLRYFYLGAGVQNFTFTISKTSGTGFNTVAATPSAQNLTIEVLAPNTTQNGSATVQFKDAAVSYTNDDAIGCQTSSSGLATATATIACSLGGRSTSTSGNVIVLRIVAAAAWTGVISNISVA